MRAATAVAAGVVGLIGLTACSSGLTLGAAGDQSSPPSAIVVDFKVGVPARQAKAEVKRCHPLSVLGVDTARSLKRSATSILIWGPQSGTASASALRACLKAAPGVADQDWTG
ncbi:MAG TPA: hypothetical protein VFI65_26295 [Streptosporangiaceae bacterium]|nr:hypothetical protein [Streptosporangiaceae bacterium]